jgi:hypothetical protein
MKVGVIVVRKQWNNAPSFLVEGIKRGITELLTESYDFQGIGFSFCRFTVHEPGRLHVNYEDVKAYDLLLFPVWIGNKVLKCNLAELKAKGLKIVTYTGLCPFGKRPPFDYDLVTKELFQGDISSSEWKNLQSIDKFLVVKSLYPFQKEKEVGCGQFEEWLTQEKSKEDFALLDFCKKDWDEPIWEDFKASGAKCKIIQMGKYPLRLEGAGVFDRSFVHYRRLCKLYSRIKVFISMNESFGYPILENKMAGNYVFLHEKIDVPSFHLSRFTPFWNKNNLASKLEEVFSSWTPETPMEIRADFKAKNPSFCSWRNTVKKIIHELLTV